MSKEIPEPNARPRQPLQYLLLPINTIWSWNWQQSGWCPTRRIRSLLRGQGEHPLSISSPLSLFGVVLCTRPKTQLAMNPDALIGWSVEDSSRPCGKVSQEMRTSIPAVASERTMCDATTFSGSNHPPQFAEHSLPRQMTIATFLMLIAGEQSVHDPRWQAEEGPVAARAPPALHHGTASR